MLKVAVIGLGKMGSQVLRKLEENGTEAIGWSRSIGSRDEVVKMNPDVLWFMLPAETVETELENWGKLLPNAILVDAGNSDYRKTKTRPRVMDVGTSGGVWGYQNGFAMMVGGEEGKYKIIEPILKILAEPYGAYHYFGPSGAGHYVKMVHNAIEYGMMQSLAEGYRLLKEGPYKNIDLISAGDVWQHRSVITSWLNELTRDALKENPTLEGVDGFVAESGEAKWALETSKAFKIETPAIQAAFDVRLRSQKGEVNFATRLLAMMRNAFGGHKINQDEK